MRHTLRPLALLALLAPLAAAEPPGPAAGPPAGPPGRGPGAGPGPGQLEGPVTGSGVPAAEREAIAWFGTWKGALAEAQRTALDDGIAKHQATTKDMRTHMAEGRREGVDWKTEIPVTDPGANRGR